jgi:hypothetical protein
MEEKRSFGRDRRAAHVPEAVVEGVSGHIAAAMALLEPHIAVLTAAERRRMLMMGPKTSEFVLRGYENAVSNPDLAPSYIDLTELGRSHADAVGLDNLLTSIHQLEVMVSDTHMKAKNELYGGILGFYKYLKELTSRNIAEARVLMEELRALCPDHANKRYKDTE